MNKIYSSPKKWRDPLRQVEVSTGRQDETRRTDDNTPAVFGAMCKNILALSNFLLMVILGNVLSNQNTLFESSFCWVPVLFGRYGKTVLELNKTQKRANHIHDSWDILLLRETGPWFNIKIPFYQYRKFHCGDKTIVRSSYLHNGISILVRWHIYTEVLPSFFVQLW